MRRVRHDDIERFCHDVRVVGERAYEFNIFMQLNPHELGFLFRHFLFKEREIRTQVHFARIDDNLNGEIKRIKEVLEAERNGVLFVGRFKPEVDGGTDKHAAIAAVFENNRPVPDFLDWDELLRRSCWFCCHIIPDPGPRTPDSECRATTRAPRVCLE